VEVPGQPNGGQDGEGYAQAAHQEIGHGQRNYVVVGAAAQLSFPAEDDDHQDVADDADNGHEDLEDGVGDVQVGAGTVRALHILLRVGRVQREQRSLEGEVRDREIAKGGHFGFGFPGGFPSSDRVFEAGISG